MKKGKASVIILTYNHQDFIQRALLSVAEQSYEDIEIIIGDDASSDGTREVIDRLVSMFHLDIIKCYQPNNLGIPANFNSCLNLCSGEIIFLMGGDDVFLPDKVRRQMRFMRDNEDVSISYHDVEVFDSKTDCTLFLYSRLYGMNSGGAEALVTYGSIGCGSSIAVRNKDLPLNDVSIIYSSDWLWYIEILMSSGGSIRYFDGVLARYRRHFGNVTSVLAVDHQYADVMRTLDIIDLKYPSLKKVRDRAAAERRIAFSFKYALRLDFSRAVNIFLESIKLDCMALPRFFLLRFRRLFHGKSF